MTRNYTEFQHCLRVLEYEHFLRLLASYTQTDIGRALVLQFLPGTDESYIKKQHSFYRETIRLKGEFNLKSPELKVRDILELLRRIAPMDAVAGGDDLLVIKEHLQAVSVVARFASREECLSAANLRALLQKLKPYKTLNVRLERALDPDGNLTDDASPELNRLRRRIRQLEENILERLNHMLRGRQLEDVVQEKFVTMRNGRFVIPVKRSEVSSISGVVHDYSGSGQTVFLEPVSVLPLENEWSATRMEEEAESLRILAELSAEIRENREGLLLNQKVLAEFDVISAVADWALDFNCCLPTFGSDFLLINARHPLLEQQFRENREREKLVPLQFELKAPCSGMVITGSNTGGKTVALKTVGLLSLIAQAGLPVPADSGSMFKIFDRWFADIGDEQSITASLSTFGAHVEHVIEILKEVIPGKSLALLDELGTGTDPLEGAALACAILQQLVSQSVVTIATTHLGVVKTFVHEHEQMVNAAVRFNTKTLQPEYALEIGRPGASHALVIAQRLGLPHEILDQANKMLSSEHLHLENMLAKMEEDQRQISQQERELQKATSEITANRNQLKNELEQLRRERKKLLNEAYRQAAGIVDNTRRQMDAVLKKTSKSAEAATASEVKKSARRKLLEKQQKLSGAIKETKPKPVAPVIPETLVPGQTVWVESLQSDAEIVSLSLDQKKAVVRAGNLRFTVSFKDLGKTRKKERAENEQKVKVSKPRPSGRVNTELNLIGCRTDEAAERITQFLSQASLANLQEVRIIHGFGTGRLKDAVHETLKKHPLVKSFRLGQHEKDPGGAGATHVELV